MVINNVEVYDTGSVMAKACIFKPHEFKPSNTAKLLTKLSDKHQDYVPCWNMRS